MSFNLRCVIYVKTLKKRSTACLFHILTKSARKYLVTGNERCGCSQWCDAASLDRDRQCLSRNHHGGSDDVLYQFVYGVDRIDHDSNVIDHFKNDRQEIAKRLPRHAKCIRRLERLCSGKYDWFQCIESLWTRKQTLDGFKSQSPTALLRLPFGLRLRIDDAVSSNDCLLYVYCYGSYGKFLCNWRCDRGRATASLYPIHLASESANGEYYPAFLCLTKCFRQLQTGFEILDEPEEPVNQTDIPLPAEFHGDVQFEHVGFAYDPKKPLIKDLNFEVKAGQTVAIVGPTGAGKTTLINLLMRFYDVNEGRSRLMVLIRRKWPAAMSVRYSAWFCKDAWLYEGTIGDNIRFGKLDATDL